MYLSVRDFPPAVSQGAIGVCARSDDAETSLWLRQLDDPATRLATTAERTLLRRIEGGCQVPLGALATLDGETLSAYAAVCAHDGSTMLNAEGTVAATPANAVALGERLAEALLAKGAGPSLRESAPLPGRWKHREHAERRAPSGRGDARRSERWAVELERGLANTTFRRIQTRH